MAARLGDARIGRGRRTMEVDGIPRHVNDVRALPPTAAEWAYRQTLRPRTVLDEHYLFK